MGMAKQLMKSITARHARLAKSEIRHLADIAAWMAGDGDIVVCHRIFKRLIIETEYAYGRRRRKNKYPSDRQYGVLPCERHPDRRGVYLIDGKRYCRPCGVTLRRKMQRLP